MKKIVYLIFLLLVIPVASMPAMDTFYVDPFNDAATDDGAGTEAEPWFSLNTGRWTEGCRVVLKSALYIDGTVTVPVNNVTLEGTSKDEIFIMGTEDDEFAEESAVAPRFFQVFDMTFTLKNLTLKNMRQETPQGEEQPAYEGMLFLNPGAVLNLENVNIEHVSLPKARGGAIFSEGTLNCTNVSFKNCLAAKGAGIYVSQAGRLNCSGCTFKDNSVIDGVSTWRLGAAICVETPDAEITIDKCYFEGNSGYDLQPDSPTKGGAIYMFVYDGRSLKVSVSNSTFYKNTASLGGGILIERQSDSGHLELSLVNNTFMENSQVNPNDMHGTAIKIPGYYAPEFTGKITFINNTFYHNIPDDKDKASVAMNSLGGADLILLNNLVIDQGVDDQGNSRGWSWVFDELGGDFPFKSVTIKNNVMDDFGGGLGPNSIRAALDNPDNRNVIFTETAQKQTVKLAFELSIPTIGVPYLPITDVSSVAVDAGLDELFIGGANVIPATDMRGASVAGDHRDIGAYEFNGNLSVIEQNKAGYRVKAYPNPFTDAIRFGSEVRVAEVFDMAGICRARISYATAINTEELAAGFYLVRMVDQEGVVQIQKMQK